MNSKPRLLLVDDNQTIAKTLAMVLEASNFDVTVAHDGLTALEAFRNSAPDLVLADIVMPGINGIELAEKVREAGSTPVLLFSGQTGAADLLEAAALHGKQFRTLPKPVHPTILLETIHDMLLNPHDPNP